MQRTLKGLIKKTGLRRTTLAAARMCCERHVLAAVGQRRVRTGGRIFCYHSVGQPVWGVNDVSPARFRRQIELALRAGYRFVPASEIAQTGGGPKDLAITFDDGLRSTLTTAAPILAEYGVPWSLFVVSDWADGDHTFEDGVMLRWSEIEKVAALGAEIGSHSVTHPNFSWLSPEQTLDELARSRRTIEQRLGIAPTSFAIPLGQSGNWPEVAAEAARQVGYTTVYAQAEETRPGQTVARTFVTRFDDDRIFSAALGGVFDRWEEWV
ncbi:MAG: polysaccharide deacetylase family protein [Chloroflexota bacterium]